jgi:hypothetical protein
MADAPGQLVKIDKLEAGGDPLKVWETLNQIIDALNDITISIVPAELCSIRIQEGDIQFSFTVPAPSSPAGGSDGGSQPTSGDTPGDVTGMALGG